MRPCLPMYSGIYFISELREKSRDNVQETALACDITTLSCHHLDHATHDHLTTSTVNTDHDTTSTVPHNDEEGWKRLGRPPTTTGLETHLHLSVRFFFLFLFLFLLTNLII